MLEALTGLYGTPSQTGQVSLPRRSAPATSLPPPTPKRLMAIRHLTSVDYIQQWMSTMGKISFFRGHFLFPLGEFPYWLSYCKLDLPWTTMPSWQPRVQQNSLKLLRSFSDNLAFLSRITWRTPFPSCILGEKSSETRETKEKLFTKSKFTNE